MAVTYRKIYFFLFFVYSTNAFCDTEEVIKDLTKVVAASVVLDAVIDAIDLPKEYSNWEKGSFPNTVDKFWSYKELVELTGEPSRCEGEFVEGLPSGPVKCFKSNDKLQFSGNFAQFKLPEYNIHRSSSSGQGATEIYDKDDNRIVIQIRKIDDEIVSYAEGQDNYYKYIKRYISDDKKGLIRLFGDEDLIAVEVTYSSQTLNLRLSNGDIRSKKFRIINSVKIFDRKGRLRVYGSGNTFSFPDYYYNLLVDPFDLNWRVERYWKRGGIAELYNLKGDAEETIYYTKKGVIKKKKITNNNGGYTEEKYKKGIISKKESFTRVPEKVRKNLSGFHSNSAFFQKDKVITYYENGYLKEIIAYKPLKNKKLFARFFSLNELKQEILFREFYDEEGNLKSKKKY